MPLEALVRINSPVMDCQAFDGVLKGFGDFLKGVVRFNDYSRDCQGFDDVFKDMVHPLRIL